MNSNSQHLPLTRALICALLLGSLNLALAASSSRIPDGVYGCYNDSVGWQGAGNSVKFSPSSRNGQIKISGMQYQVHEKIGQFRLASDGKVSWQGGYYSKDTEARYGTSDAGEPAIFLWWPDVKTGLRCLRGQ